MEHLIRRKKSAAERRAQRLRAEGRRLQHFCGALHAVHTHRGGQLSPIGRVLMRCLQQFADIDSNVPGVHSDGGVVNTTSVDYDNNGVVNTTSLSYNNGDVCAAPSLPFAPREPATDTGAVDAAATPATVFSDKAAEFAPFSGADAPVEIDDPDVAPATEVNDSDALRIEAQKHIDVIAGLTSHFEYILGADGTGALSPKTDTASFESESVEEKDMDVCVDKDIIATKAAVVKESDSFSTLPNADAPVSFDDPSAALLVLQELCEALQESCLTRVGVTHGGEWFSEIGTADAVPITLSTDRVDLQRLGMTMKFLIYLVTMFSALHGDLRQVIGYGLKPRVAQELCADDEVVWSSMLFDMQVHYTELQNMKLKLHDFSSSSLSSRREASAQFTRFMDFQAKVRAVVEVLHQNLALTSKQE